MRIDSSTLPYLADHQIAGRPVLPLAGAVDLVRALWSAGAPTETTASGLCLRDTTVLDGLVLDDTTPTAVVSVRVRDSSSGTHAFELVRHDAGPARAAFRGKLVPAGDVVPLAPPATGHAPRLTLSAFYSEHTFHGPLLHAVTEVSDLGAEHIRGHVCAKAVPGASPLLCALDGGLQLLAFWATETLGTGGLPLDAAEIHLRRVPADNERLCVLARLASRAPASEEDGVGLRADLDISDTHGRLVLAVRGLRAELRDLGRTRAVFRPPQSTGAIVKSQEQPPTAPDAPAFALPSSYVHPEEFPELKELEQRLALAQAAGIANPYFREHDGCNAATARIKGRELINFSSYNYLGLSGHPEVNEAVKAAVDRYGSSVSASRVASGQRPLHRELEAALAELLGTEDSVCMVGGHATNVSGIGHLLGPQDLLIHDALAHDSILGGARLSGARRRIFAHNDPMALEQILRETRAGVRRVLIAVEGVYSMDGDIALLPEFVRLKKKYGAMLLVDEAHSIGVLGATGRGVGEHHGVRPADVDLWMGTLSKALASCGGYLAGSRRLVQYLRYTVPGFIYSVGLSPANAAAALAATRILKREPERARLLQERAAYFLRLCKERGVNTGLSRGSAVVPCIIGNSYVCLRLSQALEARGINVQPILYPAVEENQARLRFFISVTHTEEQLRTTADILAEELDTLVPERRVSRTAAGTPAHALTDPAL